MNTNNLEKILFKKTKKNRLWGGIAMLILGLGIMALGGRIFIGYMTASKELTKCDASQVENGYYKFSDVWTVVGQYGYDNNGTGYILWVVNEDNPDDSFFMGMYFSEKDEDIAAKASDAFWEAYDNYTESDVYLSGAGRVRDMRSDEKDAFQEAMYTLYGDNSYQASAVYKTLEYKAFPRQMSYKDWIMIVAGLIVAVVGIWMIVTVGGGSAKKKILDKVARSGMNPDQLASEIAFGQKFGAVTVTKNAVFCEGFTPMLVFLKDIIWCFGKVTTTKNKAYGLVTVSTTKTFMVNFVDRSKQYTNMPVKSQKSQDDIITAIHEAAPYIICGYNEDIAMAEQHNFADLINAVDHRKAELENPQPAEQPYVFNQKTDEPVPEKIEFKPGSYGLSNNEEEPQQPQGYDDSAAQQPLRYDDSSQQPYGYGGTADQQSLGYNDSVSSLGDVSDISDTSDYTDGLI